MGQIGAGNAAAPHSAEIDLAWALFQVEQLCLDGKEDDAAKRLDALRATDAGSAEGLFDIARAPPPAARGTRCTAKTRTP